MRFADQPVLAALAALVAALGCDGAVGADSASATAAAGSPGDELPPAVCNGGRFRCFARVQPASADRRFSPDLGPRGGFGPTELSSAYNLDSSADPHVTIAVIGAYSYANAESDLATYRSQFGLPACTIASGCLTVLNQQGQTSPPPGPSPAGDDWTVENALDLEMASAGCPHCKLMLVEADNDTGDGLLIANDVAVQHGANVISNSWGTKEGGLGSALASEELHVNHPGVAIFVSTGDKGFADGPQYPASSAFTIAVGGTTLVRDRSARGWSETAWDQGGSACSGLVSRPAWQVSPACAKRATADVSAVGDPNTGVAVFNQGSGGWQVLGGTSAAAPLVAAMFAQTGHANTTAQFVYQNLGFFFDVTSGNDGTCQSGQSALCNAGIGWDGPTGVGTPNAALLAGAKLPTLKVSAPFDGAVVPPGFTVNAACTSNDASTITEVDVTIDAEPLGKLTAAPYTYTAPTTLANGQHTVIVTCTTTTLAQASQTFSVTQADAACSTDANCPASDLCYNGACIPGPSAVGGLGATCTGNDSCSSGSCASDGKNNYCTVTCSPAAGACPSGFSCISASGTNICFPETSSGGCNAGGSAPLIPAGLGFLLFISRRRSRQRAS